jgi:hypothetical protein
MTFPIQLDAHLPDERALHDVHTAIDRYLTVCEKGEWRPAADEALWREVLGDSAPAFPYASVPPERDLRMNCAAYECDHRETRIELPCTLESGADAAGKLRFLQGCVRWMTEQRGHDLCWEHADMLRHAAALTRGETAEPSAPRPSLEVCMARCNRFATCVYAVVPSEGGSAQK